MPRAAATARLRDADGDTIDGMRADPAVDAAVVVADQEALPGDGFDQVQVDASSHAHQHNIAGMKSLYPTRRDRDACSILHARVHRLPMRAYLNALAALKRGNLIRCRVHN